MKRLCFLGGLLLLQCTAPSDPATQASRPDRFADVPSLTGRPAYLRSPFLTAGDRVYLVGHQDGQFPDLGWHVTGEMGGLWDHPIKLLDGFVAELTAEGRTVCLTEADTFRNYPFANAHLYRIPEMGLRVERMQFVPDGKEALVVDYTFTNERDTAQAYTFRWTGVSDLRPVWLGERTGMVDSTDRATWDEAGQRWVVQDAGNPWYVVFGSETDPSAHASGEASCAYQPAGRGVSASLRYNLHLPPRATVHVMFTVAGSYRSRQAALATYEDVQTNAAALLEAKRTRYARLAQQSELSIPDKEIQQAFAWLKYSTDWLVREVPEQGRGLSAGLPDYPWWFGVDNAYALKGVLAIGQTDLVYRTIALIHQLSDSANGNGRIVHEVSTNGAVFNPGNVNETPQFASLIWTVYEWTGDRAFLERYYPTVKEGLDWLMTENDRDGNLLPDGFGMMEIHGLNSEMVDVAAYTQRAFADAAAMAQELGEDSLARRYADLAAQLRRKINDDFWVPAFRSYADFIGTTEQARHLIDDALIRADTLHKPWAVDELQATRRALASYPAQQKQGFVLHHNWVVNTPMEMGIADTAKALAALETGHRFVNPYGVFVTGIDRDETAGEDESSFAQHQKVFTYTGAVMTLPTGVQAIAENNYGRPDQALDYLRRMTRSFSFALPGSLYEVSPDFGMMAQAWTIYSFAVPLVQQFFGIRPRAYAQTIRLQPQMPSAWNEARLANVKVGDNALDMQYYRTGGEIELQLHQRQADWSLEVAFPAGKFARWEQDGKVVTPRREGNFDVWVAEGRDVGLRLTE
ncbi:alpha-L-rhamnosidase [Catalinimonas alkaloidigena]|uniref:Alpha-L-rhamnosidase n=1 Tax=Catalinimonas alkaloidigena TaxID=1075417 RepID=A0A1G8WZF5_9BACT|nr:glycogen debranching protein [Catalinimonas alkaloidigena]SDJ83742.1 alpha-L-rhamnosidase [Catalinimonas alkaloidigena]